MKIRDFSKIYFSILFLHLVVIYKPESMVLYYMSKPLLLFSLIAYFIHVNGLSTVSKKQMLGALLFSLAGDVLLMREGELFFMAGMAAFLLAHVFYLLFYFRQKPMIAALPLLAGLVLSGVGLWGLYSYVNTPDELEPYLYTYALVLLGHFVVSVLFSFQHKGMQWLSALGAFLFIVSDFLLSVNKFNESSMYLHLVVMLTYGLSQYFIVLSVNDYLKKEKS